MRIVVKLAVLAALTTATAIAGAQGSSGAPPAAVPVVATLASGALDFGDDYRLVSATRTSPRVVTIAVMFSGGCAPHDLTANYRVDASGFHVALHHAAHGDRCESLLSRRVAVTLPPNAATATPIHVDARSRSIDVR